MRVGDLVKIDLAPAFGFDSEHGILISLPPSGKKLKRWIKGPCKIYIDSGFFQVWADDFKVVNEK